MSHLPVCVGVIYSLSDWLGEFYRAFSVIARVVLIDMQQPIRV